MKQNEILFPSYAEFLNEKKETDYSHINFTYDQKASDDYMDDTAHFIDTGKFANSMSTEDKNMIAISIYVPKNKSYRDWRLFIRYMKNKDTIINIVDDGDDNVFYQTWKNGTDKKVNAEIDRVFMNLTGKVRVA